MNVRLRRSSPGMIAFYIIAIGCIIVTFRSKLSLAPHDSDDPVLSLTPIVSEDEKEIVETTQKRETGSRETGVVPSRNNGPETVQSMSPSASEAFVKHDQSKVFTNGSNKVVKTRIQEFDRDCDPCEDPRTCLTTKEDRELFEMYRHLCAFNITPGIDPSTWEDPRPGERFVLVTMLEPSWRVADWQSLRNVIRLAASLDAYFPYKADHLILYDDSNTMEMRLLQRVTNRKMVFVDVVNEFKPTKKRSSFFKNSISLCLGDYSYRAMCRFGSGPIFWLDVLQDYDYFIRLDEDAYFTKPLPTNLVENLKQTNSGYGYVLENPSSSQCRIGLDKAVVDFINEEDHDKAGRPWVRLGDFKFSRSEARNDRDYLDVMSITKQPLMMHESLAQGSLGFDPLMRTTITYYTYNCNFEVVDLAYFRHPHYRRWWKLIDDRGLFFSTRMGDHEVKTTYLDLFAENSHIVCFADLPYYHHHHADEWCRYNSLMYLFNTTRRHRSRRPQRG